MFAPEIEPPCGRVEDLSAEEAAKYVLENTTGLNINTEHGSGTPARFVRMLKELTTPENFNFTTFDANDMHDMIVVQDMPFVSVCNHHVIPFVGKAHIAYVPDERMAGLSKFARLVKFYAKQLQVQERLTQQVANAIEYNLSPLGVGVVIQAEHFCMTVRGVQTPGTLTTTATMRGVFADHTKTAKAEFMSIIGL